MKNKEVITGWIEPGVRLRDLFGWDLNRFLFLVGDREIFDTKSNIFNTPWCITGKPKEIKITIEEL